MPRKRKPKAIITPSIKPVSMVDVEPDSYLGFINNTMVELVKNSDDSFTAEVQITLAVPINLKIILCKVVS